MENFEYEFKIKNIHFRYAKGKSIRSGDEIHNFHEILFYIKGSADFLAEKFEEKLCDNTLIIIPKSTYHKFKIHNQEEYTRLFINFPQIHETEVLVNRVMSDIKIIHPVSGEIFLLLKELCRRIESLNYTQEEALWFNSAFNMLICELILSPLPTVSLAKRESHQLISRCIEYIDRNLCKNISVQDLSREMGVSVSSLHLCFKKHLGVSVYKYITEKRLILANNLITDNESPTKIYTSCGFNDYPTFYKAYLKKFGHKPSDDKNC